MNISENERFDLKVNKTDTCWLWTASTVRGYGHFGCRRKGKWTMLRSHIHAYERYKGDRNGLLVLHKCDNPLCVNPEHLFLGTHKDNSQDMIKKGRFGYPRAANHQHLSFTFAEQVRDYHKNNPTAKQIEIASRFNISTQQTSRMLRNNIWSAK